MIHSVWTELLYLWSKKHAYLSLAHTHPQPCDENPLTHHKINKWGGNTGLSVCELKDISSACVFVCVTQSGKSTINECNYIHNDNNQNNSDNVLS